MKTLLLIITLALAGLATQTTQAGQLLLVTADHDYGNGIVVDRGDVEEGVGVEGDSWVVSGPRGERCLLPAVIALPITSEQAVKALLAYVQRLHAEVNAALEARNQAIVAADNAQHPRQQSSSQRYYERKAARQASERQAWEDNLREREAVALDRISRQLR